LEFRAAPSCLD
jgi:hypothetical protein